MNDNAQHTGQNWTGRAPRTLEEAGLQYGKFCEQEEIDGMSIREKLLDIGLIVAFVASMVLCYCIGAAVGF